MTKYRFDHRPDAETTRQDDHNADVPPDPDSIVIAGLYAWMRVCKRQLPAPCPTDFAECARWWREQMQEPERHGETFLSKGGPGSDAPANWTCGYAVGLRSTLLRFLALTDAERQLIVGAREDGIFWRGDDMNFFAKLIEETTLQREMGVEPYRRAALRRMSAILESMLGQPTTPKHGRPTGRDRTPDGSAEWYAAKTGRPLEPLTVGRRS